jgi:hypothetical protein
VVFHQQGLLAGGEIAALFATAPLRAVVGPVKVAACGRAEKLCPLDGLRSDDVERGGAVRACFGVTPLSGFFAGNERINTGCVPGSSQRR